MKQKLSYFLICSMSVLPFSAFAAYDLMGDYSISGNLGVGTDTPSKKLEVNGTGIVKDRFDVGTASGEHSLHVVGTATLGYEHRLTDLTTWQRSGFYDGVGITGAPLPSGWAHIIIGSHRNYTGTKMLQIYSDQNTNDDSLFFRKTNNLNMNPTWFELATRNTNNYFNSAQTFNDRVAIGINNASSALHVANDGTITFQLTNNEENTEYRNNSLQAAIFYTGGYAAPDGGDFGGDLGHLVLQPRSTIGVERDIIFGTALNGENSGEVHERMRIDSNGKVIVGTSSKNSNLEVNGDTAITGVITVTTAAGDIPEYTGP